MLKKAGIYAIIVLCSIGAPLMLMALIKTGNPLALINLVWSVGLVVWAVWLLGVLPKKPTPERSAIVVAAPKYDWLAKSYPSNPFPVAFGCVMLFAVCFAIIAYMMINR